eukprot:532714-Rhodomonas_salina.4
MCVRRSYVADRSLVLERTLVDVCALDAVALVAQHAHALGRPVRLPAPCPRLRSDMSVSNDSDFHGHVGFTQ